MSTKHLTIIIGIPVIALGGAVALFFLDPSKQTFFPKCAFHLATGYSCPGCGQDQVGDRGVGSGRVGHR
jgi:hypothetical protein